MCEHHGIANHGCAFEVDKPTVVDFSKWHRRDVVRAMWSGSLIVGTGLVGAGCADVAEVFAPSDSDLAPLAAQAWTETKQQTPISRDARANARLQAVGAKISSVANIQNAAWEFVVFDSKELNAFCLPGGKVGFYKGLIDFVDNDDQIAAVMGHEVGHVALRHAALRAGQQTATSLALQGAGALAGSSLKLSSDTLNMVMAAAGAGAQVGILLPFSRSNESDADRQGVDYMAATGYNTKEAVRLWEKMGAASTDRPMEWMSTHPNPETRIAALKDYITSKGYATF